MCQRASLRPSRMRSPCAEPTTGATARRSPISLAQACAHGRPPAPLGPCQQQNRHPITAPAAGAPRHERPARHLVEYQAAQQTELDWPDRDSPGTSATFALKSQGHIVRQPQGSPRCRAVALHHEQAVLNRRPLKQRQRRLGFRDGLGQRKGQPDGRPILGDVVVQIGYQAAEAPVPLDGEGEQESRVLGIRELEPAGDVGERKSLSVRNREQSRERGGGDAPSTATNHQPTLELCNQTLGFTFLDDQPVQRITDRGPASGTLRLHLRLEALEHARQLVTEMPAGTHLVHHLE